MAQNYSFFNAVNGDRVYSAEDFASYFSSFVGNGVYANPATNLQVVESNTNPSTSVTVCAGKAWINGYFYQNTANLEVALPTRQNAARTDAIVVRLDLLNRLIEVASVANFTAPTRNANVYELVLATIAVPAEDDISDSDITDKREDESVCGIVTGAVDQIDTDDLFRQYNAAFETWFEGVRGQLSGDVAGNLQNQINTINTNISNLSASSVGYSNTSSGLTATTTQAAIDEVNDNLNSVVIIRKVMMSAQSISASNGKSVSVTLPTVAGYVPVALAGWYLTGTNASSCTLPNAYINNGKVELYIKNVSSSSISLTTSSYVNVIYAKGE